MRSDSPAAEARKRLRAAWSLSALGRPGRIIGPLLAAAVLAAVVAGCSGDDDAPDAPSPTPPAAADTATALPTPAITVETTVETEYYTVLGSSTQEILSYIKEHGPIDGTGARASGLTRAEWSLEWSRTSNESSCRIRTMTILMDLVIVLPDLDITALATGLHESWATYAENIAIHEQRHVDIYVVGAQTLKDRMEGLTAQPNCSLLEAQVTGVWEEQRAQTNAEQDQFHAQEDARIESARRPFRDQIDLNNARLADLLYAIDALDAQIDTLDDQIETAAPQVEGLSLALKAIEEEYKGRSLPDDVRQQYESLRSQYIALLPAYNMLVNEYNAAVTERNQLAAQHGALTAETNALIETYNWLN